MNADTGAPCSVQHLKKKHFIDTIKKGVTSHASSRQISEPAAIACVKLCKISTYIPSSESTNVTFYLVKCVLYHLKVCVLALSSKITKQNIFRQIYSNTEKFQLQMLLFTPSKPFTRGQVPSCADIEMMIDCMVSFFRITPHNADAQKACLLLQAPPAFHFVVVSSFLR